MKELAWKARIYILLTIFIGSLTLVWTFSRTVIQDPVLILILSALASLSLIFKVLGATKRTHYNISYLIYSFTFIVLGVPSTFIVIIVSNVVEWAYHKYPWYIQSFNITSYIIAIGISGVVLDLFQTDHDLFTFWSLVGVLLSIATFTFVNHLTVGLVIWLARGENLSQSGVMERFSLLLDYSLLVIGAGGAFIFTLNPYGIVLSLIPLYLIYSTLKVPALERKSNTDPKTGLYNSEYFSTALESELARANRFDNPLTVVMADLDLLRNINNTYGHLAGDVVLIGIANIIKNSIHDYDVVARFGGEEYAILMPETTPEQAYQRVEALRTSIAAAQFTVPTSVNPIQATTSFGIAGRKLGLDQPMNEIIHNADVALYRAKLAGRNRAVVYREDQQTPFEIAQAARAAGQPIQVQTEPPPPVVLPEPAVSAQQPVDAGRRDEPPPEKGEAEAVPARHARPPWAVNVFITAMTLAAAAIFYFTFDPKAPVQWFGLLCFAVMVVITEWLSVDIYVRETSVSTSAAPMIAGFLLFGPIGILVLSVTFATVALIKHHSMFNRFLFNTSNQIIAGSMCLLLIALSGNTFSANPALMQFTLALFSASMVFLSTSTMTSLVIDLDLGIPVNQVWKEKFSWLLIYYLVLGLVAYALIFGYYYMGLLGILVILVPLLTLRYSQAQYITRTKAMVSELQEKNTRLESNARLISRHNEDLLGVLAEAIEQRDPFAMGHSKHVALYATMIAREMNLPPEQIENIRKAGLLHDIGKLGIPESILFKPHSLRENEYEAVKKHPVKGTEIISNCTSLQELIPIILHHHEHWDGSGYPGGLTGDQIPLEARIITVADAIEAMASDRPYRKALDPASIQYEMQQYAGIQFDPKIVQAFLDIIHKQGEDVVVNSAGLVIKEAVTPVEASL